MRAHDRAGLLLAALLLAGCAGLPLPLGGPGEQGAGGAAAAPQPTAGPSELVRLRGELRVTGDTIDPDDPGVAMLVDLSGYVRRNRSFNPSAGSQVLAPIQVDLSDEREASFVLNLPARPAGTLVDVDQDGRRDEGVRIFNVAWWYNEAGGPFADGDDRLAGWAQTYASTHTDPNTDGEIDGGRLIVWAPDGEQQFPTSFGKDGLLFTADDPVAPIGPGYSVVDMVRTPFRFERDAEERVELFEPDDYAQQDYSDLSYVSAFHKLVERARSTYAFVGVAGKEPDWDALLAELDPLVEQAQRDGDALAYYRALRSFTHAFRDGHVSVYQEELEDQAFEADVGGGFGFAARELDDGRFMVSYVGEGGPAEQAGVEVGDDLLAVGGRAVGEALGEIMPYGAPYSTDEALRYQQLRYLLRAPVGEERAFTLRRGGAAERSVTLTAVDERESFDSTSIYAGLDGWNLPVESWYFDDNVGNILVGSNSDDVALTLELFERALDSFEANEVRGVVIDLRQNDGGQVLGLAGFLSDAPIVIGRELQRDTLTGEFETRGAPIEVRPRARQYEVGRVVVLVGHGCISACEAEAYALSQVEGVEVVGHYATAGAFAAVIGDEYLLPEQISVQLPKWRYETPDGELFLEGRGVAPTYRVPVDRAAVLADQDPLVEAAIDRILGR